MFVLDVYPEDVKVHVCMGWGSSLLRVKVILMKACKSVLQQLSSELRLLVLHSFEKFLSSIGHVYFSLITSIGISST